MSDNIETSDPVTYPVNDSGEGQGVVFDALVEVEVYVEDVKSQLLAHHLSVAFGKASVTY